MEKPDFFFTTNIQDALIFSINVRKKGYGCELPLETDYLNVRGKGRGQSRMDSLDTGNIVYTGPKKPTTQHKKLKR